MPQEKGNDMSENPDTPVNECPHENTEYDPGNYVPPFGWEQQPGVFCLDCGEEIEQEEYGTDLPDDIPNWWDQDPTAVRLELEEEARNPL